MGFKNVGVASLTP